MRSCLYEVRIMHSRREPTVYAFRHTVFMFYLDLSERDEIARRVPLFGWNRPGVYSYRDSDHIGDIRAYLKERGIGEKVRRIGLLTNVRTFGYIFNPVSFYFCFDAADEPLCVVVEIGNTFGELKYFYLPPEDRRAGVFSGQQTKYYYISPFTDLDNDLRFDIQVPGEEFKIGIDVLRKEKPYFFSTMHGRRKALSTLNLFLCTLKYPLVTLKVIALIHWHAAVLHFIKRVPHHAKEESPHLQRDRHRAWPKG